jgi:hypothetical protein
MVWSMLAPTVGALVDGLLPWLDSPDPTPQPEQASSPSPLPEKDNSKPAKPSAHHDRRNVYVPVPSLPPDTLDLSPLSEAQFNASATPTLPVVVNKHFPLPEEEPGLSVDLKFHAIDLFHFQITSSYLVVPTDGYIDIVPDNPKVLYFYDTNDVCRFTIDFHWSIRDIFFPPDFSFQPPRYVSGQILSYASSPGQVSVYLG